MISTWFNNVNTCAFSNRFRLVPKDELGFGTAIVGETKILFLSIENIGYFDFNYKIISKTELDELLETTHLEVQKIS